MSINVPFTNTDFEPSFDRTQRDVLRRLLNMLAAAVPSELPIDTAGAVDGDTLVYNADNEVFEPGSSPTQFSQIVTEDGTSRTAELGDAGSYVRFTNGSPVTYSIPSEGGETPVTWPDGAAIEIEQNGNGAVTVEGSGGVVIHVNANLTAVTNGQYAVAGLKRVDTDEWVLFGNLVAA